MDTQQPEAKTMQYNDGILSGGAQGMLDEIKEKIQELKEQRDCINNARYKDLISETLTFECEKIEQFQFYREAEDAIERTLRLLRKYRRKIQSGKVNFCGQGIGRIVRWDGYETK